MNKVRRMNFISRDYIKKHPRTIFLFGDNLAHRGFGGQAKEMRGEPNAVGIPTKRLPTMSRLAFFDDSMLYMKKGWDILFKSIGEAVQDGGRFDEIVLPENGLGTGFSKMQEKCPKLLAYLNQKLKELEKL